MREKDNRNGWTGLGWAGLGADGTVQRNTAVVDDIGWTDWTNYLILANSI